MEHKYVTPQSQKQAIYAHLMHGNSITPLVALKKFKCFRLAARINDLRKHGIPIESKIARNGSKRHAEYSLA